MAYLSQGTAGILVYNTSRNARQQTININSSSVGLDDSANIYNVYIPPTPSPSGSQPPSVIQKFLGWINDRERNVHRHCADKS